MEILKFDSDVSTDERLRVALAQISPVFLNREATIAKVVETISAAADQGSDLCVFGEALIPGYPFWVENTEGAKFESPVQQEWYAEYLEQGVDIERGDLDPICEIAKERSIAVYIGIMERPMDRGGHTLYASIVYIDRLGKIGSVHRKLQPTYEERLVWGMGDGHGLRTHPLGKFTAGGLNCWENWLPLARASLYGQGEDLHVAIWPGGIHNTEKLTPVLALEGRSYVLSVSGIIKPEDIDVELPDVEKLNAIERPFLANGGTCIASPNGEWLVEPITGKECLIIADLDHSNVRKARHSLDVAGHYSRPDVLELNVNRKRLSTVNIKEE